MAAEPSSEPASAGPQARRLWLRFAGVYLVYSLAAHLVWEIAQLPLYTLWQTAPAAYVIFAVLHCTGGDLLIASAAFGAALLVTGVRGWPPRRFIAFVLVAVASGAGYTFYSEWLNVFVRQSWAYSEWMPLIPGTGIGLSPILQWLLIPTPGLAWTYRVVTSRPGNAATAWSPHAGS